MQSANSALWFFPPRQLSSVVSMTSYFSGNYICTLQFKSEVNRAGKVGTLMSYVCIYRYRYPFFVIKLTRVFSNTYLS